MTNENNSSIFEFNQSHKPDDHYDNWHQIKMPAVSIDINYIRNSLAVGNLQANRSCNSRVGAASMADFEWQFNW